MSTADGDDARPEQVAFQLARRLLRGETIDVIDDAGRRWSATASTLSWEKDAVSEIVLERADAFDVLSALAERLSAGPATPQTKHDDAPGESTASLPV